jgi:DNA polymerase I-like protein with 3'-5' exonuclease and polymerase domains
VSTVHDELWIDVDIPEFARVAGAAKRLMEDYPEFKPIPITVSGAYTVTNWAEKQEVWK